MLANSIPLTARHLQSNDKVKKDPNDAWHTTGEDLNCSVLTSSNNKRIQLPNTREYALACNADLAIGMGEISNNHTNTIIDCINLCEATSSCTAVAFSSNNVGPDSTNCQLKSILIGRAIVPEPSNGTTLAYVTASTSCEALRAQGRRVQLPGQRDYTLQCNSDASAQADILVSYTGSLNGCLALCDRQSGCNAVAYRESDQKCSQKSLDKSSNLTTSGDVDVAYLTDLALGVAFPDKDQTGVWGPTIPFPVIPVAAALIPNSNKVFVWSADFVDDYTLTKNSSDGRFTYFATMDIVTGEVSEQFVSNTHHNMFCPGISFDPTGRLVVTGGSTDAAVSIYDPDFGDWIAAAPMHIGRGYQSSVLTSQGDIFVLGGSWSGPNETKFGEVYDPKSDIWTELPGCPTAPMETADKKGIYRSDNHAWLFSWKDGAIFQAGPSRAMNWFSASGSGSYKPAGLRSGAEDSMCGNAVMYDIGQILTVGGSSSYDNSSGHYASQVVTLGNDADSPVQVVGATDMAYPRVQANSVVPRADKHFPTSSPTIKPFCTQRCSIPLRARSVCSKQWRPCLGHITLWPYSCQMAPSSLAEVACADPVNGIISTRTSTSRHTCSGATSMPFALSFSPSLRRPIAIRHQQTSFQLDSASQSRSHLSSTPRRDTHSP